MCSGKIGLVGPAAVSTSLAAGQVLAVVAPAAGSNAGSMAMTS